MLSIHNTNTIHRTIRTNLDPLSLYSDYQIWNALEQVNFHDKVSSLPETLEVMILFMLFIYLFWIKFLFIVPYT